MKESDNKESLVIKKLVRSIQRTLNGKEFSVLRQGSKWRFSGIDVSITKTNETGSQDYLGYFIAPIFEKGLKGLGNYNINHFKVRKTETKTDTSYE